MAILDDLFESLAALDMTQITAMLALATTLLILLIAIAGRRRRIEAKIRGASAQDDRVNIGIEREVRHSETQTQFRANPASAETGHGIATGSFHDILRESKQELAELSPIPQDSVLRRHYLANEAAKQDALHNPYPTDSVLRRHYDSLHKLTAETRPAMDVSEEFISSTTTRQPDIAEGSAGKHGGATEKSPDPAILARISVPQDSVLRRHFITQLRAEIEAKLSPKPSDSVLRRHYDNMVGSELEKRLVG